MTRIRTTLAITGIAAALAAAPAARALDYNWNVLGGGSQTWQTAANWLPNSDFPNGVEDVANLSVGLTGNLNVSIGATNVTLGGLNIGGTGAAVNTTISGTGGKLVFSNNDDPDFDNDNDIDGADFMIWQQGLGVGTTNATGDANGDGVVDVADLRSWRQIAVATFTPAGTPPVYPGRVTLNSNGAPGTVNTISAPVRSGFLVDATPLYREEIVEVRGTQGLNFAGGYFVSGGGNTANTANNTLNSFLPEGATITINSIETREDNEATPATNRAFNINASSGATGRVEITGPVTGGGQLVLGSGAGGSPLSTIVISGDNSAYAGTVNFNRGNLIIASNTAFGVGNVRFRPNAPTNSTGLNLLSDNDARTVQAQFQLAQFATIAGTNSLTFAGPIYQTNQRGLINILPAGKTLTFSGNNYVFVGNDGNARAFTFDGSGKTVVTGEVSNMRFDTATNAPIAAAGTELNSIIKNGEGALSLNGLNSYTGTTTVNGGNLHFGDVDGTTGTSAIVANFGAVGSDTGALNNFFFLAKFAASLTPTATTPNSTGGLMIDDSEAAATFDFTAGDLGSVTSNGARLSLAAPETGLTFTGQIVPDNSTYRLGGGVGTLTLANAAPQLTGANNLIATNGGVVQLNAGNTYSGTTSVIAKYTSSLTATALVNGVTNNANTNRVYGGTVLAVLHLANGGAASGIGNSSNVAANLYIQGSTLRYTGTGASTDRLFTVGTGGATIESSGAGAVNFTNTGSLAMDEPASRSGTVTGTALGSLPRVDDLVIGMGVTGPLIAANTTIAAVNYNTNSVTLSAAGTAGTDNVTFTSIARTLTLGGTNTGANTLRPNIVNGLAATSVVKTGAGTWILTGANTYTGTTTVSQGTLLVNGTHTAGGAYTVAAGATLGGTGTVGGALTANGVVAPGASAGALAVSGNVTFNAGSTALIEIGGTGAGLFDELNVVGLITAGGTFDVDLINGFNPVAGNSFDVLDFTSVTGSFTLSLPALGGGLAWNTSALLTTGTISVVTATTAVPEPGSVALAAFGLVALAVRRRK